jgi:Tfp pilus assembly protein PilE
MDTLHAYETLRSKFDEDTAKTIVGAMAGLVTPSFADLATKTDIHDVKAEIEQLRLSTKADIEQLRLSTKADIEQAKTELRAEIQDVKAGMEQLRLATKADIEQLRQATKADIQEVKAGMEQLRLATKTDVAETRAELLDKMRTTTLTIIGANLAALAVATGILLKILGD